MSRLHTYSLITKITLLICYSSIFSILGLVSSGSLRLNDRLNDVWRSNDLGVSWQLSTNNAGWTPRSSMAAVYIGGTIILMGGSGGPCEYIYVCVVRGVQAYPSIRYISIELAL